MKTRTVSSEVTFNRPFSIGAAGAELPAGSYKIDTDEERKGGLSLSRYRPVRVVMHLVADAGDPEKNKTLIVAPVDLDAALKEDKQTAKPKAVSVSAGYTR